jgi:hypothetical protein
MKRLSYEPLIMHLFKIFTRAFKSKSDRGETKIPSTADDKKIRTTEEYDEQKKKNAEQ